MWRNWFWFQAINGLYRAEALLSQIVSRFVAIVVINDKADQPIIRGETIHRSSNKSADEQWVEQSLLTVEEKELLAKAARLMEELIETIEVAEDKELVQDIEAALKEVAKGRTRPLGDLVKELNLESKVQA